MKAWRQVGHVAVDFMKGIRPLAAAQSDFFDFVLPPDLESPEDLVSLFLLEESLDELLLSELDSFLSAAAFFL